MKNVIIYALLSLVPAYLMLQTQVKTETSSNQYAYHSALTTGDTIFTKAATATGSSIRAGGVTGELVGIAITEPVTRDTIILKNGTGTVAQIVLDSVYTNGAAYSPVRNTVPVFVQLPTRLDTSLIFIQKKGSKSTLFYRITRQS